ncbi:MAG: hypothetical protein GY738_30045, partial [Pseudoalteromonas sp.]|nr:hypothetical protein [Pseudoalteromonas sp.]
MKAQEDLNSDRMTGEPHPIFTTELFTEWKQSDPLGLASSLEATDYIPIIEYLKTESWAFNRVTRNPQYQRYRVFSAPSTNNVEKESLFNMVIRKEVDKKKYEKLQERKERPEDKGIEEHDWTPKQTNQYITEKMLCPHRDIDEVDEQAEFNKLIRFRKLADTLACSSPNYDMTAETMSPYMPPTFQLLMPHMEYGHLSLA